MITEKPISVLGLTFNGTVWYLLVLFNWSRMASTYLPIIPSV